MFKPQLSLCCCYCNRLFDKKIKRSIEHIIPRSMGGSNDSNNLIYCCYDCNQIRKNMSFLEFKNMIHDLLVNNRTLKLRSYNREDLQNILSNLEKQFYNK